MKLFLACIVECAMIIGVVKEVDKLNPNKGEVK